MKGLLSEIFASEPQHSRIEDMFPIAMVLPDGHTITKGGKHAIVIELRGQDYSGMDPDNLHALFMGRKRYFDFLPTDLTLLVQSHRVKVSSELELDTFSNQLSRRIARTWAEKFKETFKSKHYLILVTLSDNIKDQLLALTEKKGLTGVPEKQLKRLDEAANEIMSKLSVYEPKMLTGDSLVSYWAWLANGKPTDRKCPKSGYLEGLIGETMLIWPEDEPYMIYKGGRERYSGMLNIMAPPSDTRSKLLDDLFALRNEFSLFQTFSRFPKELAYNEADDRLKNARIFVKTGHIIEETQLALMERIQNDEVALMRHRWSLEVFGDSPEDLEDAITEVRGVIGAYGIGLSRETVNQQACFWSRFPEHQGLQVRVRYMTSENGAHFATWGTSNEGLDHNSWGSKPIVYLKTISNTDYALSFQIHSGPKALGNCMFVGGSGSGKTTNISFLIANCYKYTNFRAVMFDRLNGLQVFTNAMNGVYVGHRALDALEMNPLQGDFTSEYKTFLNGWFQALTGMTSDEDQEAIARAIQQLYSLEKQHRNLSELALAFGTPERGSIARALKRWLPDGVHGHFFNGKRDALNFDNPLVTFDMTNYLDDPEVLAPLAMHIFYQIFLSGRMPGPYVVVVDELPKYMNNKIFMPRIESALQEIRKTDGVFIGACQDLPSLLAHASSAKFKANIARWFLSPEPKAEREHYMGELNLNEKEFWWIRNTDPSSRQVLIKGADGSSVTVDFGLHGLGKQGCIFDSSSDAVLRMHEMQKEYGMDWLHHFMQSHSNAA